MKKARKMEIQDINNIGLILSQRFPFQQFVIEIFRKTNVFLNKHNTLIDIYKNMYPGLNNTKESLLFGQLCGFIIYCFENIYSPNENLADMNNDIIDYWGKITMDNLFQKTRMQENFGSGYNLLRASSLQPILLDYVLSPYLGNVDNEIPNIDKRIDFILTLHTFINILGKYYYD